MQQLHPVRSFALAGVLICLAAAGCGQNKTAAQADAGGNQALAGVWLARGKTVPDGIAAGYPIDTGSTPFMPVSAGDPAKAATTDYETEKAIVAKLIENNGDVFVYARSKFKPPAYTEAGAQAAESLRAATAPGGRRDPYAQCQPRNIIGFGGGAGGFGSAIEIFLTKERIGFVTESGAYRTIYINADASKLTPTYEGISVGRWDGDKLVIETTGFLGDTAGFWPMSPDAKVTDTLSLSEDGKVLNVKTLYEDPAYLKEPMVKMTYLDRGAPNYQFLPTNCVETVQGAAEYAKTFGTEPPK